MTGTKRVASLPKLPTVAETVPGYEFASWWGELARWAKVVNDNRIEPQ